MRKRTISILLCLVMISTPLYAATNVDGQTDHSAKTRSFIVFFRGIGNLLGMPAELYTTLRREFDMHSRLWPVTYLPRLATNIFERTASGVNDALILPWIVPFTNDISPMTEPMGLPEYPWQVSVS